MRGEGEHAVRRVGAEARETAADDADRAYQQVDQAGDAAPAEHLRPPRKVDASGGAMGPGTGVRLPRGTGVLHATNATPRRSRPPWDGASDAERRTPPAAYSKSTDERRRG